jgi:3-deoxy-7-phosphoheptulonate synthase
MKNLQIENINISSFEKLITPDELKARLPLKNNTLQIVSKNQQVIHDILDRKDYRLMVVKKSRSLLRIEPRTNFSLVHTAGYPYTNYADKQFTVAPS